MVVGDLRRVENTLRLGQFLAGKRLYVLLVATHSGENAGTLRIDVVAQELRVDTRISSELAFVERLYEVERHLGAVRELAVALHLQRGEVEETRRRLVAVLLRDARHLERLVGDGGERLLAFLLRRELALCGCEERVAVYRGQHPIGFGLKRVDLLLAVDDKRECRRLHTTDAEHLAVLSVLERVKTRGVHAQEPVADGTAQSGNVQRLILALVFQRVEALTDSLVGHRRYPKTLHRTLSLSLLHHPTLYQLTLLTGVTAVDDAVGSLHETFDDAELAFDAVVVDELDAETRRNHRQRRETPVLPVLGVVVGLFQRAEMSEGPRHLEAIALHVSVVGGGGTQYAGYILGYTWFLGYADYHLFLSV